MSKEKSGKDNIIYGIILARSKEGGLQMTPLKNCEREPEPWEMRALASEYVVMTELQNMSQILASDVMMLFNQFMKAMYREKGLVPPELPGAQRGPVVPPGTKQ